MGEWIIEPATVEALPDILQIEEACFSAPWTRKMLEAELSGNPFAHFLLAKQGAAWRSWFCLDCRVSLFLDRL